MYTGGALLVAAVLKAHGLVLDPVSQDSFLASPRLQIAVIEAEVLLGLWLLSGWARRTAWAAALVFFASLGAVSLYLALQGQSSCGCFGRVQVSPWLTFGLDMAIVAALLVFRPPPVARAPSLATKRTGGAGFLLKTGALAAVLLLTVGTAFFLVSDNPADALAQLRGDSLTITPNPAYLGDGPRGSSRDIALQVHNHTDRPVRVLGGTEDCNCVTTADLPVEVPPQGTAEVRISVRLSGTPGLFRRPFVLYTDAADQFRLNGWLTGRIHEKTDQAQATSSPGLTSD